MARKNPTSAIRGGFDYQDWWGLKLCSDWLSNPSTYQWIWFETAPEETGATRFYLDDIILLDAQGTYHLYQIKHRQQSSNAWTWDELLSSRESGSSLLQKWAQSLAKVRPQVGSACFISNGIGGEDITAFLEGKRVNISKIQEQNQDLYNRILGQLGSEESATEFFSIFEFSFGEPDFSMLEQQVRDKFYSDLRATESGINNLLLQIHKKCRSEQTQSLLLEQLRQWCEFDDPQPLKEDFFIPEDFQFFNEQIHKNVLRELKDTNGGIKVIVGKPGTGKSVYLSKLHETLSEQKIIAVRHHYHLSPEDRNPQERLNAERVIEALKAQFKQYPDELGSLGHKNSKNVSLREFVNTLASHLNQQNRTFVLIIDGLDHVIRNADVEELNKFLQSICFPQPGLWIVLGMQPIISEHLPNVVHEKCPCDTWIEMSGLSRNAVQRIVTKNCTNLNLPDNDHGLSAFIDKIFDVTQGNPLHLRYLLNELKIRHSAGLVTEYSVGNIVPYGGDIADYYSALWRQLNDKAETILFTIASINFVFRRQQLLECVSSFESNPSDLSQAFRSIQHLTKEDRKNRISVYHNSFQVFLLSQPQFEEQKIALKQNIKKWLEGCSYENLKWAELRKIEYELGNPDLLLELDRQWLLKAISHPRNSYQIDTQLYLAFEAAFEKEDFSKSLLLSHLRTYYLNSANFVEEGYEKIFAEAIKLNREALDDIEVAYVDTSNLVVLASLANDRGDFTTIDEIINELIERQHNQEYRRKGDGDMPSVTRALLETIPYDRTHDAERVYKYIKQSHDLGWTPDLFGIYSGKLLALDQVERVEGILGFELTQKENEAVLEQCVRYDLEHCSNNFERFYSENSPLLVCIFQALKDNFSGELPRLPSYETLPTKIPEFDPKERQKWTDFFFDYFLIGLLYGLRGHEKEIENWNNGRSSIWCANALSVVLKSALQISSSIRTDSHINYENLFSSLSELRELRWPEDREQRDLQVGLSRALSMILKEALTIKKTLDDTEEINKDDLKVICSTPFYLEDDLLKFLITENEALLSEEAYKYLMEQKKKKAEDSVTYFPDRTVAYAELATLARLHGDTSTANNLLLKVSNNLLGYGYHKDVYLFEVLEAIDFCGTAGTSKEKIDSWLQRISPIVESVTDYTDGDETDYLPLELAEILGKYDCASLYKNYYAHADTEDLFHAQDLFKIVIRLMSYETDGEIALGATAVDKGSFEELNAVAQKVEGAKKSLEMITESLGNISYPEEQSSSPSLTDKYRKSDYTAIPPEQLGTKIDELSFENMWSQHQYLQGWLSHWLKQGNKETVCRAIIPVVSRIGLREVSGELLDMLYPLAFEFNNDRAFEFLCRAQANDHGWQKHWGDKKKAERRWSFLKEKYPARYIEFFKNSIAFGSPISDDAGRSVPLSRGVEFFLSFGDLERAESITEAAITFSEQLMADIKLPPPIWQTEPYSALTIDEVDLLVQRLLWPSPLVRERVATALAGLFSHSLNREETYRRFLTWIQSQALESVVAVSLLPFFRTFQVQNKTNLSYIKFGDIVESLPLGSVVIHKLTEELASEMGVDPSDIKLPEYVNVNPCPDTYQINSFFQKHVNGFLAPIYHNRAEEIESRRGRDFIRQWAFTSEELVNANKIRLNADLGYFQGREEDVTLVGMSTKLSEAYRSAFIRVLQQFFTADHIPEDLYLEYAYATAPVDLTLWKINPRRSPDWWPKLRDDSTSTLTQVSLEKPIESLIEQSDSNHLLFAEGAITPTKGWDGSDAVYSFSLIGFAYRVLGPNIPTAEEVAEELIDAPSLVVLIPSKTKHPFGFLDNYPDFYRIRTDPRNIGDLVAYPLIVRIRALTIFLWQFFRGYHAFVLLGPDIQKELSARPGKDSYIYEKDGEKVASVCDWLEGLKERNDSDLPLPHGQWLEIDKTFLESLLASRGLKLGYLLKTTYKHKQYKYGDVATLDQYRLINVSGIILPC